MNTTHITRHDQRQKKRRWPQWVSGILVIAVLLALLASGYRSLSSEMESYPQLGSGSLYWHVCAIEPRPYHWYAFYALVDGKGKVISSQAYSLMGGQVKIQFEVLNLLGTPSAYKLSGIDGYYANPSDERNLAYPRKSITLDDGKTPLFSVAKALTWLSGLVNASLAQPLQLNNDGKTYVLTETQKGLKLVAEKNSPLLCGHFH